MPRGRLVQVLIRRLSIEVLPACEASLNDMTHFERSQTVGNERLYSTIVAQADRMFAVSCR